MRLLIYLLIFTSLVKKDGRTEDEKSLGESFKILCVRNNETYKIATAKSFSQIDTGGILERQQWKFTSD